jgi:hypothetical protein
MLIILLLILLRNKPVKQTFLHKKKDKIDDSDPEFIFVS